MVTKESPLRMAWNTQIMGGGRLRQQHGCLLLFIFICISVCFQDWSCRHQLGVLSFAFACCCCVLSIFLLLGLLLTQTRIQIPILVCLSLNSPCVICSLSPDKMVITIRGAGMISTRFVQDCSGLLYAQVYDQGCVMGALPSTSYCPKLKSISNLGSLSNQNRHSKYQQIREYLLMTDLSQGSSSALLSSDSFKVSSIL